MGKFSKFFIMNFIFLVLLVSFTSSEMIITQQPKKMYNLGDVIELKMKIVSSTDITALFSMELFCNGNKIDLPHKEYIVLSIGEEKELTPAIPLINSLIAKTTGNCKIKTLLDEDYILTNEFKISNLITIDLKEPKVEFFPEERIILEGEAKKESGEIATGFVSLEIVNEQLVKEIELIDTLNDGYFFLNFSLPKETPAGQHPLKLTIYEKNKFEEIINSGVINYNIQVLQVPTSLEIAYENKDIEPGTSLKIKAILHDQTGVNIDSTAIITIKNEKGKIIEEAEKSTDEFLELDVAYNELPSQWIVRAVSTDLENEETFNILEKKEIKVELVNDTVILTNIGNVIYKDIVLVKISGEPLNVNANLDVDKSKTYSLSAPDGEYRVEVILDGKSLITGNMILTGKAIDIKEASGKIMSLIKYPLVWAFIIVIFALVILIMFKVGYKKTFFEYLKPKRKLKKEKNNKEDESQQIATTIDIKNKAELSLSIKGSKQGVSLVCLKIKNMDDIEENPGNTKETLQKIIDMAEKEKAYIYENQENLFFILTPAVTKTFKNERTAIDIAKNMQRILANHNRLFRQRIDYGISINYGSIIMKKEHSSIKFMGIGNLMSLSKKIATLVDKEILLSKDLNGKLTREVKTEKQERDGVEVYEIKEVRDIEEGKQFANNLAKKFREGKN